jgi:DNA-binding NarL/FixJ family response regulator
MGMRGVFESLEALDHAARAHNGRRGEYPDGLTARELEILRLVSEGATDRQIALQLFISEKTVHNHVSNVLAKTGCSNRAEAASYAVRRHLV